MLSRPWQVGLLAALGLSALFGCSSQPPATAFERGKRIYEAVCTKCHNLDPTQAGSRGPDVAGSARELLEARVLRGEYPPGYKPKRTTREMIPLPLLAPHIDDLTAYLGSFPLATDPR